MRTLILAWQDPDRRRWYPIGQLKSADGVYTFVYTKGAEQARAEAGFQPLASLPELSTAYVSDDLFPLFTNRVLPQARPEYQEYLEWLSVPSSEHDPVRFSRAVAGAKSRIRLRSFRSPSAISKASIMLIFFCMA
jgi:hypothetical protein